MADSEEDWIKQRAYRMWEEEGYPTGKDTEHWERARLEFATLKPGGDLPAPSAGKMSPKSGAKAAATKSSNGKASNGKAANGKAKAEKPAVTAEKTAIAEKPAKAAKASSPKASPSKNSPAVAAAETLPKKRTKKVAASV